MKYWSTAILCLLIGTLLIEDCQAQRPRPRPAAGPRTTANQSKTKITDPQLLDLHKEFVSKAEKLAAEYERKKDYARAREVYESLTRLLPEYEAASRGLSRILNAQSTQDRKVVDVQANKEWQDTGIDIVAGNPVKIEAKGSWYVVLEVGPRGLEIPKEFDPRNSNIKVGTLMGMIASKPDIKELKPFAIGNGTEFIAKESGRLILRMFDLDLTDNRGKISVMVQSTFGGRR